MNQHESVNASTLSLTIASSLFTSAYDSDIIPANRQQVIDEAHHANASDNVHNKTNTASNTGGHSAVIHTTSCLSYHIIILNSTNFHRYLAIN